MNVVFFSSGIGSYCAAKRVAEKYGTEDLILLFADTLIEDADNYRFLEEAAANVGGELVRIADGRSPFELFEQIRWLGNSRVAPCSHILKQKVCRKWLTANCPADSKLFVGIDWSEIHRLKAIQKHWEPYTVEAPMTEPTYLDRWQTLKIALSEGLTPPRLYSLGLAHSNCGGGCVRAGQAHWLHVLKVLPDVFLRWETEEKKMRAFLGKDISMLKKQINNEIVPFTLEQLRQAAEEKGQIDLFDWGGCGCFVESEEIASPMEVRL